MPTPEKDEEKDDFVERCIPIVIDDGTAKDPDQAVAVCNSIWEESKREASMYFKTDEIERRTLRTSEIRLADGETPKIAGHAAVFNTWADIGGWFKESIKPGAFAKTIKENDIRALVNHNENYVLGRNRSGTLRLNEDAKGLFVEITPAKTTWADDLLTSMRRGDINQMSFGFKVNKQEMNYDADERVLLDVTLFDVSVVTFPAYPTTTAEVRSAFKNKAPNIPKMEDLSKFKEFDSIVDKMKRGETLTPEEIKLLNSFVLSPTAPPAKHAEAPVEPPAKHSPEDIRKVDKWTALFTKAELEVPSKK